MANSKKTPTTPTKPTSTKAPKTGVAPAAKLETTLRFINR